MKSENIKEIPELVQYAEEIGFDGIAVSEILAREGHSVVLVDQNQKLASATFLITRVLADGVRFAAIAIVIQAITGWSIPLSILLILSLSMS